MSVHYSLNKKIRIKDLKEKGFTILSGEKAGHYPIVIESKTYYTNNETGNGSWVGVLFLNGYDNIDDVETSELEGHTGYAVIYEICELFNAKFVTDTYVDNVILEAEAKGETPSITEEDFDICTKAWKDGGFL